MSRWFASVLLLPLIATPASAQTLVDGTFPPGLPIDFAQMHAAVSDGFYDPASTRYRKLVVVDRFVMDLVICGWISSRNSRGVYTPYYPFGYRLKDGYVYMGLNFRSSTVSTTTMAALADFGCPKEALGL